MARMWRGVIIIHPNFILDRYYLVWFMSPQCLDIEAYQDFDKDAKVASYLLLR